MQTQNLIKHGHVIVPYAEQQNDKGHFKYTELHNNILVLHQRCKHLFYLKHLQFHGQLGSIRLQHQLLSTYRPIQKPYQNTGECCIIHNMLDTNIVCH